jgi:hypothetical protein
MHRCWNCGKVTGIVGRPARSDDCPYCRAELRSCRGCRFYDASRAQECAEERADSPQDKTKVNFCDYFVAADIPAPEGNGAKMMAPKGAPNISSARAALDKLFGK